MADPLSITSSAVGILSVALTVCDGITQYYNSYKRAPEAVNASMTHVTNLTRVLNLLRSTLDSNQHKYPPDTLDQVNEYISSCERGVRNLETKLKKCKTTEADDSNGLTNIKNAGKRLIYPFRESTLAKLCEIVSELMYPLSLALDALQITQNSLLATDVTQISASVRLIQYGKLLILACLDELMSQSNFRTIS